MIFNTPMLIKIKLTNSISNFIDIFLRLRDLFFSETYLNITINTYPASINKASEPKSAVMVMKNINPQVIEIIRNLFIVYILCDIQRFIY
jgi:hypothetical protein